MSSVPTTEYRQKIKDLRETKGLTQTQFAELVGVSFATVNRWENGQSRPNNLAWKRILELAESDDTTQEVKPGPDGAPTMDFAADPNAVSAVAEAHRLAYGHLFNPAFATETALIDPLPHQRIAVYEKMLGQMPLRFLLADDAGAGKTIMTGLYVREMLSRRLIRRILIVPPAGLVGNWEQEMRKLFRLSFRIVRGDEARTANPFSGAEGDRVIVSVDTLVTERLFNRLKEPETEPYDLVVFDEAHKLSAARQPDFRVRKTDRYRLAAAIAGADVDVKRWMLPWSARHLLLLTATPHAGKDSPYYFLWRLLLPETLSTHDAFDRFPRESRQRHFIRRTKEEMLHFNGQPLYPQRNCDTLSYNLTTGQGGEQQLYDETTEYIRDYYNRAGVLNRSAARLAMGVFQRRLASSTYALMRSFERRLVKLDGFIENLRNGALSEEQFASRQQELNRRGDQYETSTADETEDEHEKYEDDALGGAVAVNLAELIVERLKVRELLETSRKLMDTGEESKFEKLREVLRHPNYSGEKLIIFTEHRDTAEFLVRRLEGLGFTDQVALIHGGLDYQERERQVEFFRRPATEGGANYLVATDAAGEGINLQFCWLMVNYDIPWNPGRLEQRMGRIHRYGQKHDPVLIVNLVAGGTREGRVMKTLLEKLEVIREQLQSDKVFDVVGRLFEEVSMTDYLRQALTDDAETVTRQLEGNLTENQVLALEHKERTLYGEGGDVRQRLPQLNEETDREIYRKLLPGYVRRFVERAAPLLDLRIEGDLESAFSLAPDRPRAADPLLSSLERYSEKARELLTVYKPTSREDAVWMHPGEPVFDCLSDAILDRFGCAARRGAVFSDPYADEPYLFHIARVTVEQRGKADTERFNLFEDRAGRENASKPLESRLVGLRQSGDGSVTELPVEHLLLLRGAASFAPSRAALASSARDMVDDALAFAREEIGERLAQLHRGERFDNLPARMESVNQGFDFQAAELTAARSRFSQLAREGDRTAAAELANVKDRQRRLTASRNRRLAELQAEPERIQVGDVEILVHALAVPVQEAEALERYDADVEAIAVQVATAYEERLGATVTDVSKPELARRLGLPDWPGFDLASRHPAATDGAAEERAIEVKGRAGSGDVHISDNEWSRACILRDNYWLYVVFDCAAPRPRLVRVQDPFAKLLVRHRDLSALTITQGAVIEAAE